ncbi:ABC transporter ATP-binding protein [Paenibacillus sp. GCM10027627]|uniref:ABC transporter ATP-binding protein n=1 Tax=unclassified Paenibacillus TaxID=185978 RepID=UPI0036413091
MIKFHHVSYRYGAHADFQLKEVDLHVTEGEFVLLTGVSGCGKTTLTRCINGIIPHFHEGELQGEIIVGGRTVQNSEIYQIGQLAGSVFQDPRSQFFTTNVMDELAFGCENYGVPRHEIYSRLEEAVTDLRLEDITHSSVFKLSSGQRQRLAIASAYMTKPIIYVMDEPSANLDAESTEQLRHILMKLKKEGCTIIIAEHRLYYLQDLVDRVVYMVNGRIERQYLRPQWLELQEEQLMRMGLRKTQNMQMELRGIQKTALEELASGGFNAPQETGDDGTKLEARNLSFRYKNASPVLQEVSFEARAGDIIGVVGTNGAGKTTLAKLMCGLLKPSNGQILLNGKPLSERDRRRASYFVMQDCDFQLFASSVEDELRLGNGEAPDLDERVELALDSMHLKNERERHPASLSGGQKQRVSIAVSLVKQSDILWFDEPTSGLDGFHMRGMSKVLRQLAASGKIVLVISHDAEFLALTCTRLLHLDQGKIVP